MTATPGDTRGAVPGGAAVIAMLLVAVVALVIVRLNRPILAGPDGPAAAALPWPDMRLDVNAASAAELTLLPGIGPTLAERIVDDRAARGPFGSIDELDRVHRIGPVLVERVRPYAVAE